MSDYNTYKSTKSDNQGVYTTQCSYWWVSSRKNFGQFLVCGLHNHIWGQLPPKVLLILNEGILKKMTFLIFLFSKINFKLYLTLFPKLS